jgi:spermidine synthase
MEKLHYIKDEMLVHIPVCTHALPKKVLTIGGCENLQAEVEKHSVIEEIVAIDNENVIETLAAMDEGSFDIVIVAVGDYASDRVFWGHMAKLTGDRGVVTTVSATLLTEEEESAAQLRAAGELFKIVMPYRYEALAEDGHLLCKNMLLASSHYHPTADINLQRADLTEGFEYYNSDIAIGAFHLPTVIRKKYAGLIKL